MVLLFSILYALVIGFAIVQSLFLPDYFGYFSYRQSTPRGKAFICFLVSVLLYILIIVYMSWKVESSVFALVLCLTPLPLFLLLYFCRIRPERRFFTSEERMLLFTRASVSKGFKEFNTSTRKESLTHYEVALYFPTLAMAKSADSLQREGVLINSLSLALTRMSSDGYFLGLVYEMPASPKDDELIEHITGLAHDGWQLGGEFAYFQAITHDRFQSKILTAKG